MSEKTLNQTIKEFDNKTLNTKELWYDWFCKETSLEGKTKRLMPKVKRVAKSNKIDPEKSYVFFTNRCPMVGKLFDDFRICDIESGDVQYNIVPSSGFARDEGESQVYGKENDFKEPLVSGTWKDVCEFFNV